MAKWKDMKMETPRDRLKKRRKLEQERKEKAEREKKKKLKMMLLSVVGGIIAVIVLIIFFVSFNNKKEKLEQIKETKKVNIIRTIGDYELRKDQDDVYLTAERTDNVLEPGSSIRLKNGAKLKLDFGNETVMTLKNGVELTLDNMEVEGTQKAHIEMFFENGVVVVRKPSGRGEVIIENDLGTVYSEGKLTVFKVENDKNRVLRIAVKQGEVQVEAKEGYGKIIVPKAKAIIIDGTKSYVETSKLKDVNTSLEGWD